MNWFFQKLFPLSREPEDLLLPIDSIMIDNELPCTFYPNHERSKTRLLLYFHGNAEDASIAGDFIRPFMSSLGAHAVVVEYPTYGDYAHCRELTEQRIYRDSERAYEYFKRELKLSPKQIIIAGRSIGSGASSHLASQKDSLGFILISPLAALDIIVIDKVKLILKHTWVFWLILTTIFGALSYFHSWNWLKCYAIFILSLLVVISVVYCSLRKFRNLEKMRKISQPTLIIHGIRDEVIEHYHSEVLINKSGARYKKLELFDYMTHNQIDPHDHLEHPIANFFQELLKQNKFEPIDISRFTNRNQP